MKSKHSLDEKLAKLSGPGKRRVLEIAKAITAACKKAEYDEDYPEPADLAPAVGFRVSPQEFKIAECVRRRQARLATTLH